MVALCSCLCSINSLFHYFQNSMQVDELSFFLFERKRIFYIPTTILAFIVPLPFWQLLCILAALHWTIIWWWWWFVPKQICRRIVQASLKLCVCCACMHVHVAVIRHGVMSQLLYWNMCVTLCMRNVVASVERPPWLSSLALTRSSSLFLSLTVFVREISLSSPLTVLSVIINFCAGIFCMMFS